MTTVLTGRCCPFLACLVKEAHTHPACPDCGAVRYGNAFCDTCCRLRGGNLNPHDILTSVTLDVTEGHIRDATGIQDPVELAALDAVPGALRAQSWFSDAESREMAVTVWLNERTFITLGFTFPAEAFDFINDFVDGKPVAPFRVTAEVRS